MTPSAILITMMLSFASYVSGYSIPANQTPIIHIVSEDFTHHKLGKDCPEYGSLSVDTGEIYLATEWREEDAEDRCVLAHELTHWLQQKHGRFLTGLSPRQSEVEAYKVTLECFKAYNLSKEQISWAKEMVKHPHVVQGNSPTNRCNQ